MSDLRIACMSNFETNGTLSCAEKTVSFQGNPEEAVKFWQQILAEDIKAGKPLKEYRALKFFQKLTQDKRNEIAGFIRERYSFQFNYPPGKICLAAQKDSLANDLKKHSSKQLLILLHSISGVKKPKCVSAGKKEDLVNTKVDNLSSKLPDDNSTASEKPTKKKNTKTITMGEGNNKIAFEIKEGIDIEGGNEQKLTQIYNLVVELNEIIPSKKVKKVRIIPDGGEYESTAHDIGVSLGASFLEITAHEMGHAIFTVLLGEHIDLYSIAISRRSISVARKDEEWQKIYYLSLGFENYEIVDDSNYADSADAAADVSGHPYDDAGELFASSVMVYRLHPDKFIENILDPCTKEGARKVGKLIFSYLRDKIFARRVFSKNKSLRQESFEIEDSEIIASMINALDDGNPAVRRATVDAINVLGIKDEVFVEPLITALGDSDPLVRVAAANAIGKLDIGAERSARPLIRALGDKNGFVGIAASSAILQLGIKVELYPLRGRQFGGGYSSERGVFAKGKLQTKIPGLDLGVAAGVSASKKDTILKGGIFGFVNAWRYSLSGSKVFETRPNRINYIQGNARLDIKAPFLNKPSLGVEYRQTRLDENDLNLGIKIPILNDSIFNLGFGLGYGRTFSGNNAAIFSLEFSNSPGQWGSIALSLDSRVLIESASKEVDKEMDLVCAYILKGHRVFYQMSLLPDELRYRAGLSMTFADRHTLEGSYSYVDKDIETRQEHHHFSLGYSINF